MYDIAHMPSSIDIGYTGEKAFREIAVDMTAWEDRITGGTAKIVHVLPGSTALTYPTVTYANHVLRWKPASSDLGSVEGSGLMQIVLTGASAVGKTPVIQTNIHLGLTR